MGFARCLPPLGTATPGRAVRRAYPTESCGRVPSGPAFIGRLASPGAPDGPSTIELSAVPSFGPCDSEPGIFPVPRRQLLRGFARTERFELSTCGFGDRCSSS